MRSPLRQLGPRASARGAPPVPRWAFPLGLAAVVAHFLISGNLMYLLGVDYSAPGGNPFVKLHPGTFLALAGALLVLFSGRHADAIRRLYSERTGLATFLTLMSICAIYSVISVGFSGVAVYIESYLAPGLLLIALEAGTSRQRRMLGYVVLGFALVNVVISVGESLTQTHMIPMQIGDADMQKLQAAQDSEDFRGAALYDHPLGGALVTSLAIFMLIGMRLPALLAAGSFTVLLIGLLAFGGRAAMGVTLLLVGLGTAVALVRGLTTRRLSGGFLAAVIGGLLVLPPLILVLVTSTDIGSRIMTHLYYDDSIDVRNVQWEVLNHINLRDTLFGTTPDRLTQLKFEIGLDAATTDIENFWLLMFLNLGVIGFGVYLIGLFAFFIHLGRSVKSPVGWIMLLAAVIITSTSNSLGRKSSDLVFLSACMIALTGFVAEARPVMLRMRPRFALPAALRRPTAIQAEATAAGHTYRLGNNARRRSNLTLAGMSQP